MLGSHTSIISRSIIIAMYLFVFSEIIFFSGFFSAIFYNFYAGEVNDYNLHRLSLLDPFGVPLLNTVLLLSSGVLCTLVHEHVLFRFLDTRNFCLGIILGVMFFWYQYVEFNMCDATMSDGIFYSCFFALTRFHRFHVVVGLCLLLVSLLRFSINTLFTKNVMVDCSILY